MTTQVAGPPKGQKVNPAYIEWLWANSFPEYAKDHLKVEPLKGADVVPFVLNPIQLVLNEIIEWMRSNNLPVRIIVLKARREGVSTAVAGRFFWKATNKPNRKVFMVTHEPEATDYIFEMHKRFLRHLDLAYTPKIRYSNKKLLDFNDSSGALGGLDSAIRVGTAGKEDLGSSQAIHYLHLSELAKWPHIVTGPLLTSLLQCVPDDPDTEVIEESTAKGIGGKFYERYWGARTKIIVSLDSSGTIRWKAEIDQKADVSNAYVAIFFPWFVFPEYQKPVAEWERGSGQRFERTKEENDIVALHFEGLPDAIVNQKLCWRRWAIENKCDRNPKTFMQEYPSTPEQAFLGTGAAVFDVYQVQILLKHAPKPIMTYEILPHTGDFMAKPDGSGRLWVWEDPKAERGYVMPADVAEGIEISSEGGDVKYDFSVFDILDQLTGFQIAQWHGHIDPDLFGRIMFWCGRRYNWAWAAPERNPGGHGSTVINTMLQLGYAHRMYVERIPDPPNKPRKRYGFHSTSANIGQMMDQLVKEMRDNIHGIRSSRTLEEMLSMKRDAKGHYGAEVGRHDDCIRSLAIGKLVRLVFPLPSVVSKRRAIVDPYSFGGVQRGGGFAPRGQGGMEGYM